MSVALDFIVFNDLHLADKPPLGRKPGYREEGLAMLRELVGLATQHRALLISTGDFFHVKRPQHVSHALVQEVLDILDGFNDFESRDPIYIVPGNHDMAERGLDSLDAQPLGVLLKAGVMHMIKDVDYGCHAGGRWKIVGRPYDVQRDADPDYYKLTLEEQVKCIDKNNDKPVVMIAHGSIIPPGTHRPYPTVTSTDIDLTGINLLCSGHIHEDLGINAMGQKPNIKAFINLGALGRCSRTEANMTRTIKVLGVSLSGGNLTLNEIPLESALPAEDIFEEVYAPTVEGDAIADAVAEIMKDEPLASADWTEAVRKLGLPPELEADALAFLEDADAEAR